VQVPNVNFSLRDLDSGSTRGVSYTDPKVVFDQYAGEFVIAFLPYSARQSFIDIVTFPESQAANPSAWCTLRLSGDQTPGDGSQFADYPGLGFSSGRVTVSTNQYRFVGGQPTRFDYAQVISMKKSQLYDCSSSVLLKVFAGAPTRNPDGTKGFTLQPAPSVGGPAADQYLVSLEGRGGSSKLILWRLGAVAGGKLTLSSVAMNAGPVSLPPYGRQCGTDVTSNDHLWDTGDLRLTGSFYDAAENRVFGTTAVKGNVEGGGVESVVQWWEMAPANALSGSVITRKGIAGAADHDAAWPSLATNSAGVLFLGYSQAGQDVAADQSRRTPVRVLAWGRAMGRLQCRVPRSQRRHADVGFQRLREGHGIRDHRHLPALEPAALRHRSVTSRHPREGGAPSRLS
jgi:hypothetical protein